MVLVVVVVVGFVVLLEVDLFVDGSSITFVIRFSYLSFIHSFIHIGILLRSLEGHLDQINSITLWEGYQMLLISGIVMMLVMRRRMVIMMMIRRRRRNSYDDDYDDADDAEEEKKLL